MALKIITPPVVEPVSLAEVKLHLRLDSTDLADNLTTEQTIAPGSHVIAAAYSLEGSSVEVIGYLVVAILEAGNCSAGTVTAKLQHRDDTADIWEDVTSGTFAIVTSATDYATQELAYIGGKRYLRAVTTIAISSCEFGISFILGTPTTAEDTLLEALITVAREYCENYQNRVYITQTWELILDMWPCGDIIEIPKPPLQSVTSIKHKDTAGVESTWAATNYIVDPDSFVGRVALAYGCAWPTTTLYPIAGIRIRFVAGYGITADSVPVRVKQAMLLLIGHLYEYREAGVERALQEIPFGVKALLGLDRVVPI